MKTALKLAAFLFAAGICGTPQIVLAQTATKPAEPALVEAYLKATFGKTPPEWQARIEPDETLKSCNLHRNDVPSAEADKIIARELAKVAYPADGKLLGDWKEGASKSAASRLWNAPAGCLCWKSTNCS